MIKDVEVTRYDETNSRIIRKTDSIVDSVIDQFVERSVIGKEKYKKNMDREDLSLYEWIEHSIQESMDLILYLRKIQKTIDPKR